MKKILLLEDDIGLSDSIADFLRDNSYNVAQVYDGDTALNVASDSNFDIFVFDINVPLLNGLQLLKELREVKNTPAIFISALNSSKDVIKGFDSGCDDYIKKPFELDELLIRIKNIEKRYFSHINSQIVEISKNCYFDIEQDIFLIDGKQTKLHFKEVAIFKVLLKNRNKIVTYQEIFENGWDFSDEPSFETLRSHIKIIRKNIPCDIENIRNIGYRLNANY
jgi:DNA-binding response OmpR family regulator